MRLPWHGWRWGEHWTGGGGAGVGRWKWCQISARAACPLPTLLGENMELLIFRAKCSLAWRISGAAAAWPFLGSFCLRSHALASEEQGLWSRSKAQCRIDFSFYLNIQALISEFYWLLKSWRQEHKPSSKNPSICTDQGSFLPHPILELYRFPLTLFGLNGDMLWSTPSFGFFSSLPPVLKCHFLTDIFTAFSVNSLSLKSF